MAFALFTRGNNTYTNTQNMSAEGDYKRRLKIKLDEIAFKMRPDIQLGTAGYCSITPEQKEEAEKYIESIVSQDKLEEFGLSSDNNDLFRSVTTMMFSIVVGLTLYGISEDKALENGVQILATTPIGEAVSYKDLVGITQYYLDCFEPICTKAKLEVLTEMNEEPVQCQ